MDWGTFEKAFAAQEQIIELQTEIINGLFRLLAQHIDAAELGSLPEAAKINDAVRMRADANIREGE